MPLPYYTQKLLSCLPQNMACTLGMPHPKIPPQILKSVKMNDFVGYAPNPKTFKRNQDPHTLIKSTTSKKEDEPKFRSVQEREKKFGTPKKETTTFNVFSPSSGGGFPRSSSRTSIYSNDSTSDLELQSPSPPSGFHLLNHFPKIYRKVEIKYSKFGVEDFDFGFYNKTSYGGLETHILHSYCNAMLQVMFFTPTLRKIAENHSTMFCPKEFCLSCELGFLFRMLSQSKGLNCQASNFLRAFGNVPQASALGLFEPDQNNSRQLKDISFSSLIQNFNRFVFEQIHVEVSNVIVNYETSTWTGGAMKVEIVCGGDGLESGFEDLKIGNQKDASTCPKPSIVQRTLGYSLHNVNTCTDNHKTVREAFPFMIDLTYQKASLPTLVATKKLNSLASTAADQPITFEQVLKQSINRETFSKAWCDKCGKYQHTTSMKVLKCVPFHLNINAGTVGAEDLELYLNDKGNPWVPFRIALVLDGEEVEILSIPEDVDIQNFRQQLEDDKNTGSLVGVYELTATVAEIKHESESSSHLVSLIRMQLPEDQNKFEWICFNDFLVQPVHVTEILKFRKWKIPAFFQYTRIDINESLDFSRLPPPETSHSLFNHDLLNRRKALNIAYTPLNPSDLKPGFLCSIDAEFVALSKEETEIRSDGTKSMLRPTRLSLARVSVLRGGDINNFVDKIMDGVPFIDEWISTTDQIVDYLTEFSGIKAGDLEPSVSSHPLVPLKASYKKLRYMVDIGCIFVGHGLIKDFRIINILIPPDQVIDTVDIYFLKSRQRKLSLKFLSWVVLKMEIQSGMHDSIVDALTALRLYKYYLKCKRENRWEQALDDIYEEGRQLNFKPPVPQISFQSSPPQQSGFNNRGNSPPRNHQRRF